MNKNVVGIIGLGRIGKLHLDNIINNKSVQVKYVYDAFSKDINEYIKNYSGVTVAKEYDEILNDKEVNVIFICTPTTTHSEIIIKAAQANKNIFCEKPISFSEEETNAAYEAVKKANVKFQIGFNRRFDKNFIDAKKAILENKIGQLHILNITSRDPEPPSLDYVKQSGGIFMDMAIHDFDMMRFISDSEVEEVYVNGAALVNPAIAEVDDIDTAIISLKFANKAIGSIDNSRQAVYGYDQRLEAFGNMGKLNVKNNLQENICLANAESVISSKPQWFFLERYKEAYFLETKLFFEAITNDTETSPNFLDGIKAQKIAKAAKQSLNSGKPEKVETIS
ncbi:inositol 2-dehydrogenase [Spiroplasma alleghenense]|uniref:Myo-inositol 2-dehydrogenase / D-chiro-inositol 1-dehydrogenase n=1 Tax=Spiroplasma alleghenense TaxID=216931 RepID=A0A345Z3G5_9MOLU|nr:inositol 2-dehydrogenase [Spiroplasma alleghenense]AXK51144.1 myo-inositol 2-dehydrogenase / D-chiro-inositol 1-dehydrogenase [Spiroplasma alleghenense]